MHPGLTLAEIARELPGRVVVSGDSSVRVRGVHHDSRLVEPGDLFVMRRGGHVDGAAFVDDALARGAVALLAEHGALTRVPAPIVYVDQIADGLAFASAAVYGHPSFGLDVIGITGTNGKTTTAHLVRAAIDGAMGRTATGIIGTVGNIYGEASTPASHTTPDADELARIFRRMKDEGASHVAMEVSSHALALGRVRAVRFRVAAFTNLTQDHLDFHGSMEAYAEAKASLFTRLGPGSAVLNVDDPFGADLARRIDMPIVRVSAKRAPGADVYPLEIEPSADGLRLFVHTPSARVRVHTRLVGSHNVDNILLALGIAHALDLDVAGAARGIEREPGAPGRLERCDGAGDDILVLVDYAHTPDALQRALASVRHLRDGARVLCVFGCGGDRDRQKRPIMGRVAADGADVVIVTNDNPRSEAPEAIAQAIEEGIVARVQKKASASDLRSARRVYAVELDRAEAITHAVMQANAGDVVLVAGKGHETYQQIGDQKLPFDDRVVCRDALSARRRARGVA